MKLWIARDYEGILTIHSHEPVYCEFEDRWTSPIATLDSSLFPEVTFENSPQEVELVLPSQEPTTGDLLNQLIETKEEMRKFRRMVYRMRQVQKNYSSYESTFGKVAKKDLICKEADVDKWLRETEETEFDD